jgi:predicted NAD/FAD-dependent oxidoreductase
MKNGENSSQFSRRNFVKSVVFASILAQIPVMLHSCKNTLAEIFLKITGTNHILGHRLWLKNFPKPTEIIEIPILIIGGGITGLSAARQLVKKNKTNFLLLELESNIGGNSSFGTNKATSFPHGAHYLPLPNLHDKELISFLHESKIITHFEKELPIFDETQMCFKPQERLFIKNNWQEELIPKYGNSEVANEEINRFFEITSQLKEEKGFDGLYHFDIPIKKISKDKKYRDLDTITMKDWLSNNKFTSEELLEYVNYCCKDDFGIGIDFVSAWAGLFYFTARKHNASTSENVLTWPEGNGRLAKHLAKYVENKFKKNHLVYEIKQNDTLVEVLCFDAKNNKSVMYKCEKVICCTPQYINSYLFKDRKTSAKFQYAPWFTATISLKKESELNNSELYWDNVIYKSKGLGYIYNQHQTVNQIVDNKSITYYYSFSNSNLKEARKEFLKMKEEEIKNIIISDLSIAHHTIKQEIETIEIYKMGHGMISPTPNFIFSEEKEMATKNIEDKIFFAHSDLSGISVFEEAFHQGIDVVNQIFNETTLDS